MKKPPIDIVDKMLTDDVELLKEWIEEIKSKIERRKALTRDMMDQLKLEIEKLEEIDQRISYWGPGYRSSIDHMRTDVGKQIGILKNEARNQEINFWRDTSALEKELRILTQAYTKAKTKKDLLDFK